jgi:hypothetical protein
MVFRNGHRLARKESIVQPVRLFIGLTLSAILLDLVLVQPNTPKALTWDALTLAPLELPVLLLGALALGRLPRWPLAVAALALVAMILVKLLDFTAYTAFGRQFDPVVDAPLIDAGVRLLSGSVGTLGAIASLLLVMTAVLLAGWLVFAGLRLWARAGNRLSVPARAVAGVAALLFAALAATEVHTAQNGWKGWNPPGSAFTSRLAAEKIRISRQSMAALSEFAVAADNDPWRDHDGVLGRLDGRDVVVVFIESYGRAAFDNPLYATRHRQTLAQASEALEKAGLAVRSGWLTSPVKGGQSWLAHGTLASGLTIGDQRRYGAMLASPRQTLYELAAGAGYLTRAVVPAIVLAWPDGPKMGFEEIFAAKDLGYAGQPFNWVTMPDQYTLTAYDRLADPGRPVMAEIALISSHAPWTPVAEMVPWEDVGDGHIFDLMATAGPTPREVWADRDGIRDHYGRSLDYSVRTVLDWAGRKTTEPPLLVILGDHQAADFVSQEGGHDVPVHLVGPPEAIALFDGWQWTKGLEPEAELEAWPMSLFRDRFLSATSPRGTGP